MKKLTAEQILELHKIMLDVTGGLDGIRDMGLLESAINASFSSFDGNELYPTIESKAARLGIGIVKNHPFTDGNKRTGLISMLVFLELNGIVLDFTNDELIKVGLALADGSMSEEELRNCS